MGDAKKRHDAADFLEWSESQQGYVGKNPDDVQPGAWARVRRVTGLRAIRLKCLDCCCGSSAEVRLCVQHDCPLWPVRLGRKPKGWRND